MSPCPCPREGLRHLTAHSWACCVPRAACGRGTFRNRALTHVLSFRVSEMSSPGDHLCAVGEGGKGERPRRAQEADSSPEKPRVLVLICLRTLGHLLHCFQSFQKTRQT